MIDVSTNFAEAYRALLIRIRTYGSYDVNQRTKAGIAFLPDGWSFVIRLHDNILPTCGLRRTRPHIAAAETAWCFRGETSVAWLNHHTKIWNAFSNDNGVMEAYGYRWKHQFGLDQIKMAIERFQKDPTDRRVWITSYHPGKDLTDRGQKTVPCPVGFTLSMFENRLNSSFVIRSSDVLIGLPLDVMRHAFVMRAIANSLNAQLGHMRILLAHPHLYENQWDTVDQMLNKEAVVPDFHMPTYPWTVDLIAHNSDGYVNMIKEEAATYIYKWPDFDPKVEVVR